MVLPAKRLYKRVYSDTQYAQIAANYCNNRMFADTIDHIDTEIKEVKIYDEIEEVSVMRKIGINSVIAMGICMVIPTARSAFPARS